MSLESLAALPHASEEILGAIAARCSTEADVHLRRACVDVYLRHGAAADLARAVRDASPALTCEVLSTFNRSDLRLAWSELEAPTGRAAPDISLAVLECLVEPLETEAFRWVSNLTAVSLAIARIPTARRSPLEALQWKGLTNLEEDLPSDEDLAKRALLKEHLASLAR